MLTTSNWILVKVEWKSLAFGVSDGTSIYEINSRQKPITKVTAAGVVYIDLRIERRLLAPPSVKPVASRIQRQ